MMDEIKFEPNAPTVGLREPTLIQLRVAGLQASDRFTATASDASLQAGLTLAPSNEPEGQVLTVDLRRLKDPPPVGDHLVAVSVHRAISLKAAASISVSVTEARSCLALGGVAPKITVASDGSLNLRIAVFNRCGHSVAVDLKASWGPNGLDISAPSLSLGPGGGGVVEAKISVPGSDLVDLVRNGEVPRDLKISLSSKGAVGGELIIRGADFQARGSAGGGVVSGLLRRLRSTPRTAMAGGLVVVGVIGLILFNDDDDDDDPVSDSIAPVTTPSTTEADATPRPTEEPTTPVPTEPPTTPVPTEPPTTPVPTEPPTTPPPTAPQVPEGSVEASIISTPHISGYTFDVVIQAVASRQSSFPSTVEARVHDGSETVQCGDSANSTSRVPEGLDGTVSLVTSVSATSNLRTNLVQDVLLCGPDGELLDAGVLPVVLETPVPTFTIIDSYVIGGATINTSSVAQFRVFARVSTESPRPFDELELALTMEGLEDCYRDGPNAGLHDGSDRALFEVPESQTYDATGGVWYATFDFSVVRCEANQSVGSQVAVSTKAGSESEPFELVDLVFIAESID